MLHSFANGIDALNKSYSTSWGTHGMLSLPELLWLVHVVLWGIGRDTSNDVVEWKILTTNM